MNETAGIGAFLAAVAGLGIIILVIVAGLWILKSIGLSQMAKNRGIENEWLAWLPVADLYIMGKIVEEMNLIGIQINNLGLWFPVISLLGGLLSSIPILGIILFIGILIFQIAFIYKLFSLYTDQATIYTVLCVFFAFLWPIFIFSLRNNAILDQDFKSPVRDTAPPAAQSLTEDIEPIVISSDPVEKQEEIAVTVDESFEEIAAEQEEQASKEVADLDAEDKEKQS